MDPSGPHSRLPTTSTLKTNPKDVWPHRCYYLLWKWRLSGICFWWEKFVICLAMSKKPRDNELISHSNELRTNGACIPYKERREKTDTRLRRTFSMVKRIPISRRHNSMCVYIPYLFVYFPICTYHLVSSLLILRRCKTSPPWPHIIPPVAYSISSILIASLKCFVCVLRSDLNMQSNSYVTKWKPGKIFIFLSKIVLILVLVGWHKKHVLSLPFNIPHGSFTSRFLHF